MFRNKQESPAAEQFEALLDEVIEDFKRAVAVHEARLEGLREAMRDR